MPPKGIVSISAAFLRILVFDMPRAALDFYEVQSRQRRRSLLVFGALVLVYFAAVGLITLAVLLTFGIFAYGGGIFTRSFLGRLLLFDLLVSTLVAWFHYQDARKFGARYILDRLEAAPPDPGDRYHSRFLNTLEEIRIAAGAPRVAAYVLPTSAINSMGLVEADGTPAVAVTEGLLAECTRDELQAVAAHELAHIVRGDALYVTLVCSLANVFEKMRDALEPEAPERPPGLAGAGSRSGGGGAPLIFIVVTLSSIVMRILGTLISRERELLADAAAVEFGREPMALARAIYKAHVRNSFVGDFSAVYAPLFIVSPDSGGVREGFFGRVFNTHPPLMKRIGALAGMAAKSPEEVVRQVWDGRRDREGARETLTSFEESGKGPRSAGLGGNAEASTEGSPSGPEAARIWQVRGPGGAWEGPMTVREMVSLPRFTSLLMVRNTQEGVEAKAREFPQVRDALRGRGLRRPLDPGGGNKCPRCGVPLTETFYEGVGVKACPRCRGRLVAMALIDRIIARKEVAFSEALVRKAGEFKARFLSEPVLTKRISETQPEKPPACPDCGYPLRARPYSYAFFIPVDKCLSCHKIWFDADELEILQILVEDR
jgi:Zn-dependent protease with chaperone function/Zn-finger nucleic acid-binding protein